ncbi:MAG: type VI secretion system Vgr family protein [Planctomycetota bacterium]|jgi:type VI secretion system secreted protein VgrG
MPEMVGERLLEVTTPLGDGVLLFYHMTATEELGRLFHYDVELWSKEPDIALADLLGQTMTVKLKLRDESVRCFNGYVSRFAQVGTHGSYTRYRAILRPWLWFLTRTADCRIFQKKTVVKIVKEIFEEHGFTDIEEALNGSYREWEYNVQYRETDFNYVSRLMEQEGIYYYFKHEEEKHTLVLADDPGSHEPISGYEEVPFVFGGDEKSFADYLQSASLSHELQPCAYALTDYDFEKPKTDLKVMRNVKRDHAKADYEMFDFPGEYLVAADGEGYALRRIEELQAQYERLRGAGPVRGLMVGGLFSLTGHHCEGLNKKYLVVSTRHELKVDTYRTTSTVEGGTTYSVSFAAMDSEQPFRALRTTPKPVVQGPQTAVVVGKSGEEIWTDKHGRVKLQFHWDRYGKSDENSSCWVRVSQAWAGKKWGGIHIPRIGQEVIVEFLAGDADRPIVTGRVYNGDNMPPYELSANQTQSGIKSRSTKEGTPDNFNEIRMEDKKGEEELYIHAEKNESIVVENDKTESVGHDETISIGNDRTEDVGHDQKITVGNDETITIGNNRTDKVGTDETRTVGSNRSRTVGGNETVTVAQARTHSVGINEAITVGAAQEVTVGAARTLTVGAVQATTIGANHTINVGKNRSVTVGKDETTKVGKNLDIDAGDKIVIKTGKASITMKKDGTIQIEGKDISIKGSGKIDVKASKNVTVKGKKILEN